MAKFFKKTIEDATARATFRQTLLADMAQSEKQGRIEKLAYLRRQLAELDALPAIPAILAKSNN